MKATKIISHKLLKSWNPCIDGYRRFCELFPKGVDLEKAIDGLIKDQHSSWAEWLFNKCKEQKLFPDIILKGFGNSGDGNSGDGNSGNWNSGNRNSGNWNSGYWNSGNRNSGYGNSGDGNSGDGNSGNWNSGNRNSGNWNSGNWNSGFFNSITPETILVFNKPCKTSIWDKAVKPNFIYEIQTSYWVDESQMTVEEKKADPNFYVRGGQTRKRSYHEAWKLAWNTASEGDRKKVMKLPNFNKEVFKDIAGIEI